MALMRGSSYPGSTLGDLLIVILAVLALAVLPTGAR
jgi:hypothetical protein